MQPTGDESALVEAMTAGDRQAAERLVEASYRQIYAALFRLCGGDAELAADLTQETYRKAWKALPRFAGRARFSTWLYRIAYNTFLNHLRRPRPVTNLDDESGPELAADGPPADETLAGIEEARELRQAVLALPEDLRFTVTARFWHGLSAREIARAEGVSAAAIRKRLRKAFETLRFSLEEVS